MTADVCAFALVAAGCASDSLLLGKFIVGGVWKGHDKLAWMVPHL